MATSSGGTRKSASAKKGTAAKRAARAKRGEQHRVCNLVPSRDVEQDWRFEDAMEVGAVTAVAAPPTSVDLRKTWWKIGDQESTGSCVGWATAEGVVRYHMVEAAKLSKTKPLSPRFIWMASKETDEYVSRPQTFIEGAGTSLKAAVKVARKYGAVTSAKLPFHVETAMYLGNENAFFASAAQRRITAYYNLLRDLSKWKSWLASHGPILAGVSVDSTWDNATATIGDLDDFHPATVRGSHAIAIVGYRANGRFIVRNSWGTGWGDKGFAYASPGYIADAFFNESYGVTV